MSKGDLKKLFDKRAARPEHLERMLQKLESLKPASITLEERSKAIRILSEAVLSEAEQGKFWFRLPENSVVTLYEEPFDREIKQIVRMLESLSLSTYAKKWAITRGAELGKELRKQLPVEEIEDKWEFMPWDKRLALLQKVTKLQCDIFQEGAIRFKPAKIQFHENPQVRGFIESCPLDIEMKTIAPSNINKLRVLTTTFTANASTAVHEQLHSMFMQLAIAERHGLMPQDHPLKEDAKKLLARHRHLGIGVYQIGSAYKADPEEKLTFACQKAFKDAYSNDNNFSCWGALKDFANKFIP